MLAGGHLTHAEHKGVMSLSVRSRASAQGVQAGAGRGGGQREKTELEYWRRLWRQVFQSCSGCVTPEGQGHLQGEVGAWAPWAGTLEELWFPLRYSTDSAGLSWPSLYAPQGRSHVTRKATARCRRLPTLSILQSEFGGVWGESSKLVAGAWW